MEAGVPLSAPAHTVTMACISSNQSITTGFFCEVVRCWVLILKSGVNAIQSGSVDVAICGGAETMSDVPIRFSRELRKRFIASTKIKKKEGYLKLLRGLKLQHFIPEAPAIAEFSTNEVMGHSADRLVSAFGISRKEQVCLFIDFGCQYLVDLFSKG